MKTIVVYASQYGTTKKCAQMIAERLPGGAELHDLNKREKVDIREYETVIVGGSIRVGRLLKPAKVFCGENEAALLQKRLGLYLCCALPKDAEGYFGENVSSVLLRHATAKGVFGGEFVTEKMGFFAKKVVEAVSKSAEGPPPQIDVAAVQAFAEGMGHL